jgi:uracil-DNA glycosylase
MPGEDNQPSSAQETGAMRAELAQAAAELRAWLSWSMDGGLRGFAPAPQAAAPPAAATQAAAPQAAAPRAPAPPLPNGDAMPPASGKVKLPTLQAVRDELGACTRCKLHRGRTNIVYGVGSERARLVFVGEAPGEDEDLSGEPFVGKAGQLLTRMIEAMGLRREDVYICNTVKCRPPNNRNPEPDELAACEPFLKGQLAALRAEAIVTLGKFAAQALLRDNSPISRLRGTWREYAGVALMPTFHPAYLLRSPGEKGKVWSDLQQVMQKLGLKERTGAVS